MERCKVDERRGTRDEEQMRSGWVVVRSAGLTLGSSSKQSQASDMSFCSRAVNVSICEMVSWRDLRTQIILPRKQMLERVGSMHLR